MNSPARPFADSVLAYAQAGWPAILPVPPEKSPPPVGFTGADGADTEPLQLALWAGSHAGSSVALRMPDGVIGIDVDEYEKAGVQKHGAATLGQHLTLWGTLPATWSSTARGPGLSRISFYRVPAGRYATKLAGGDVEIIQRHHRYAVVWPSPHLDAGDIYRWYDPAGQVSDQPPKPGAFPELPQAWVEGLREGATEAGPAAADRGSGEVLLAQLLADERPCCAEITSAVLTAHAELSKTDAGSRHDTATARIHHLVQLAAAGHPGLGRAMEDLAGMWSQLTAGEDRADEFDRMLLTSARKAVTAVGAHQVANDPCLVTGGLEVLAPAPADERPGADPVEPIAPAQLWNVRQLIGAETFDPRADTDQTLAQAVLERAYPALRYAYDAKGWLLRGPERWDSREDLAEWAVAQLAYLMPRGNAEAEKGSDDQLRAARRKRFMSAAPSSSIAKKMRATVVGGNHPCALELGRLDVEPEILWAGGQAWDLRASLGQLVAARIDPATPHLHSAAVTPDARPTPLWDAFTAAVWPDEALRCWALRVLSIAFTGYSDKALPILIGERDRGKTQVIALLMSVLGSYAHAADPRLLTGVDNAHASIIYALKGRRLSFIDEGPREGRLGQERLKQLTGGGDLTGNQMQRNPITFTPTHTLVLTANDEPLLTDPAVRSRTRLIPCAGDTDSVRAARAAIGHTSSTAWRREAPGVLAAMIGHAAGWLADNASAATAAAPEGVRELAELIADEQDPVRNWVEAETEPHPEGERSRALYEAFVGWSRNGNAHPSRIVNETKWGKDLTRLGYPPVKQRTGNYRGLRLMPRGGWIGGGLEPIRGGLVEGSPVSDQPSTTQQIRETTLHPVEGVEGVEGQSPTYAHARTHASAHAPAHAPAHGANTGAYPPPSTPSTLTPTVHSAKLTASLQAAAAVARTASAPPGTIACGPRPASEADAAVLRQFADQLAAQPPAAAPAKPGRTKVDPAVRAAEKAAAKAAAKAEALRQAIAAAAGELIQLPAVVTRDGAIRPIELANVAPLAEAFGMLAELTVDVETTGYPIGHADYALRTIQLGNDKAVAVLDAAHSASRAVAVQLLHAAAVLHAHSATADLVPLAIDAGLDIEAAWSKMHDTVIPALLADPQSTGSDAEGLKELARDMLGDQATTHRADEARAALFKAGKWLKDTKVTTAVERSGWAQADSRCATMVRYGASDVLDTAALAKVLPAVRPDVLERERTAQRMTARVAHRGLRIDGEHVAELLPRHRAALAEAGNRIRAFGGIDNPGSDQQVAAALIKLGAKLPTTQTGRPSVAKGVLDPFKHAEGPVGDLVRARLDYQHHETALGLFLEPYQQLVTRGDGRARPTVYTLGADTGRMSCVRPNLQQVPRQGGMRACITADPGQLLVSADFASVEIRAACALSGDPSLRHMIDNGIDLHWQIARQVFGPEATKEDRYNVKRGVFGRLYGSGIPGIARTLGISESVAASMVDTLDAMTPTLAAWTAQLKRAVQNGNTKFEAYSGRVIHLDPRLPHKALNYCVQGTARELLVDTLVRWSDSRWRGATLLPVHDEILLVVPEAEAAEATAALAAAMETQLFGVAIKAEASAPSFAWQDAS